MVEKAFTWTNELATTFFRLRLENDWLFKKKAQAWKDFRTILLQQGFPEEMTLDHMRKKWMYTYDCYKMAKKTRNKKWLYYKLFDKYLSKNTVLDKYSSWSDEWRLKLIVAYTSCNYSQKISSEDCNALWRLVEKELRSQYLPIDCCIQDLKGLWHYLHTIFDRKHRIVLKRGIEANDWPLYLPLLHYFENCDTNTLVKLSKDGCTYPYIRVPRNKDKKKSSDGIHDTSNNDSVEFQWTRDITETFIQIRLQNEWMFRERKWAWNQLQQLMTKEYGFPKTLSGRMLCHKWSSTYGEYQKAKATNNVSWLYYKLFELYLGETHLNPLRNWEEEWVKKFINIRADFEKVFSESNRPYTIWREVEKKLREDGVPLDHSLLELPQMWVHLTKTYKWKQKFAAKGMLNEVWPYYEEMEKYYKLKIQSHGMREREYVVEITKEEVDDYNNDDYDDDIKLFDLKQKMCETSITYEPHSYDAQNSKSCRTCNQVEGSVNLFKQYEEDGCNLAYKLKLICGIEVQQEDNLPKQICLNCSKELENAYKFRRKCQDIDEHFRTGNRNTIKNEVIEGEMPSGNMLCEKIEDSPEPAVLMEYDSMDFDHAGDETETFDVTSTTDKVTTEKTKIKKKLIKSARKKYDYARMCEVCGKKTKNMKSHMDTHAEGKFYKCDECDKRFKFKSGLVIHKASHNPTPKKTCEVCGKTFHMLSSYRKHFVYHANERKHACETCGKCFNTKDILTVHMRMHTDERPFTCPECGKTFRTAGCVSRHKRIVHKTTPKV